jgi:hypothetical protein
MNKWVRGVDRRTDFERKVDGFLEKIQEEHMPEKAKMLVAINLGTGEYVMAEDLPSLYKAYYERWPEGGNYICRVDGTPSMRM